jgi:hypothetical protein
MGQQEMAMIEAAGRVLILKRASANCSSGQWNDDDFDVLANGEVVGRIFRANAAPVGSPWMWTLAFGHHADRTPTHGYAATREAAMTAFAKRLAAGVGMAKAAKELRCREARSGGRIGQKEKAVVNCRAATCVRSSKKCCGYPKMLCKAHVMQHV